MLASVSGNVVALVATECEVGAMSKCAMVRAAQKNDVSVVAEAFVNAAKTVAGSAVATLIAKHSIAQWGSATVSSLIS